MRRIILVISVVLLCLLVGCEKELVGPSEVPRGGVGASSLRPGGPRGVDEPKWVLWGFNGGEPSCRGFDYIDDIVDAGIDYVALAAWYSVIDNEHSAEDCAARVNGLSDFCLEHGIERVVAPFARALFDSVQSGFIEIEDVFTYIDLCDATFFFVDEPAHQEGVPYKYVVHVAKHIMETKPEPCGLYISTPLTKYVPDYFNYAYKLMVTNYHQTLCWKNHTYVRLGDRRPQAPLIGLMFAAGDEGCNDTDFQRLREEISNAAPYCEEVWFYTWYRGGTTCPYCLVDPYSNIETLGDVIASFPDEGFGTWDFQCGTYGGETVTPVPADYDGDGWVDLSVKCDDGRWLINYWITGYIRWEDAFNYWDMLEANAVPADYDGDGRADPSVKRDDGTWSVDYAADGFGVWDDTFTNRGGASAHPVPADYTGDGIDDLSVKCDDGRWLIDYSENGFAHGGWDFALGPGSCGGPEAQPAPADYDGDMIADLAVRLDDGEWRLDYAANGFSGWDDVFPHAGGPGERPVPADYDGDGIADLGTLSDGGVWRIDWSSNGFSGWDDEVAVADGPDLDPAPADYDGDGKTDIGCKFHDGMWRIDYAELRFGSLLGPDGLVIQDP